MSLRLAVALAVLAMGCGDGRRVGKIVLPDRSAGAALAVRLVTIDDRGGTMTELDRTVSDAKGEFEFDFSSDTGANVLAEVDAPTGTLRGFWRGTASGIPVDPLTEGLVGAVISMTAPAGGRSLADFTSDEIRALSQALVSADSNDVDFWDPEAVLAFLEGEIGRDVALAAGGTIRTRTTDALDGETDSSSASFSPDPDVCNTGAPIQSLPGGEFSFDVTGDASVCSGTHPIADPMLFDAMRFELDGKNFFGGPEYPTFASAELRGSRELRFDAEPLLQDDGITPDTITVARSVYVSPDDDWLRVAEILTNEGTGERTISFSVLSELRTGTESTVLVHDDGPLTRRSRYAAVYDPYQHRATATFFFQDGLANFAAGLNAPGLALGDPQMVETSWEVDLAPMETRTVLHYVRLSTSRDASVVATEAESLLERPEMAGLTRVELAGLWNFSPTRGTVEGDPGSVFGRTWVSAKNRRTGDRLRVRAYPDGSFAIALDAGEGDEIELEADDGLDRVVRVD